MEFQTDLFAKKTAIHNGCWPDYITTYNRFRNSDNIRIADTVLRTSISSHLGSHVRLSLSRYGVLWIMQTTELLS